MKISFEYNEFKQNNLSVWIFQKLDTFFENGGAEYDIEFDFSGKTFSHEIDFTELFSIESNGYKWAYSTSKHFSSIADVLIGVKVDNDKTDARPIYRLSFIFDKTIFSSYPKFKNLRCHRLSFDDTVFEKGVHFGHIDADEIIFKPRKLGADATFFHQKEANSIEKGILKNKYSGRIGTFRFRHALEGSGKTFFVGVRFEQEADFRDAVLDNIVFSNIDEESMSKCLFLNSFLERTEFYNCDFSYNSNLIIPMDIKGFYKNNLKSLLFSLIIMFAIVLCVYLGQYFLAGFLLLLFTNLLFMPLMKLVEKIAPKNLVANHHMSTGDDYSIVNSANILSSMNNYKSLSEIYRQLKVNFEKRGDYQTAGEFYYSQRYCEMVTFGKFGRQVLQYFILNNHHWINGFGERWLRAFVWLLLVIFSFAWILKPNIDYVSTPNTPSFLLKPKESKDGVLYFDKNSTQTIVGYEKALQQIPLLLQPFIGKIPDSFEHNNSLLISKTTENNGSVAAKVALPLNEWNARWIYSFDRLYAPLRFSPQSSWFESKSAESNWLGILETILLWFFLGSFISAVKNRIRR